MRGRTIRTPEKKAKFLAALRETGGNVGRACVTAGLVRRSVYDWREADAAFAVEWDEAVEFGTEELEEEARRRAFAGVDEPVFYKGDECGYVRKYSDTLLIFLLKARKPDKYRENVKITVEEVDSTIDAAIRAHKLPAGTQDHLDRAPS